MSDEGGHWYLRDGRPCYTVPASGGGMRAFNLRWDRKLGAVPSVTTVTSCIAKAALTDYFIKQGALYALEQPLGDGEDRESYLSRILTGSRLAAKAAAEEGSRIHDAIECHFCGKDHDSKYDPHVAATVEELHRLFPSVTDWISEKSFAHPLGYGGKVDLHSPSTGIVVDFKTKDGDFTELDTYGKPKKLAWDQHIQLAAYQVGLGLSVCQPSEATFQIHDQGWHRSVPCANIFVSRTHPGAVRSHVWSADEIADGWRTFECALALWKQLRGYDGAF